MADGGGTAFVCQFLLPFLSPRTWSSSSRKGAKPGRSGNAGLAVMVGKGSGLDSNSVAPSGRPGRNCGPLFPWALHPLSSSSVSGALVMHRRPEGTDRGVRPLPVVQFPHSPSGLFYLILCLCSSFRRFYPSFGPYSKPGSNTESQIPPTVHFCPGHFVLISLPSCPRLLPTPKISLSDPHSTPLIFSLLITLQTSSLASP